MRMFHALVREMQEERVLWSKLHRVQKVRVQEQWVCEATPAFDSVSLYVSRTRGSDLAHELVCVGAR